MISEASPVCACTVPAPLSQVAAKCAGGSGAGEDKEYLALSPHVRGLLKSYLHVCSL